MNKKRFLSISAIVVTLVAACIWHYEVHPQNSVGLIQSGDMQSTADQSTSEMLQPVSIIADPSFPGVQIYLKQLVQYENGPTSNMFCVVGYRSSGYQYASFAEVYWKEKNEIILWEGSEDPNQWQPGISSTSYNTLIYSRQILNLKTDVVPTEQDIPFGSTYIVTEAWVNSILNDCEKSGNTFIINQ
jgi:hypothetical protein